MGNLACSCHLGINRNWRASSQSELEGVQPIRTGGCSANQNWRASSWSSNPALTTGPSLLFGLKPGHRVLTAPLNACSNTTVVIPDKCLLPASPRSGEDYSFSSKCSLFSELVSVWFPHVLCSIINLYSVLLESVKPQRHLLQLQRLTISSSKRKHVPDFQR